MRGIQCGVCGLRCGLQEGRALEENREFGDQMRRSAALVNGPRSQNPSCPASAERRTTVTRLNQALRMSGVGSNNGLENNECVLSFWGINGPLALLR